MTASKQSLEGFLELDHRESPGVPDHVFANMNPEMPAGAGHGLFRTPTITCFHCQKVMIVNPLRTRERAYCAKCDRYICDSCKLNMVVSGEHWPMEKIIDVVLERVTRGQPVPIFPGVNDG